MKLISFLALLLLGSVTLSSRAQTEATTRPSYSLRINQLQPGSRDLTSLSSGAPYPLNKRYENFTPDEKQTLRSFYEGMPPTDEPPFPIRGMAEIIDELSTVIGYLQVNGSLTIVVTVNERGQATNAQLLAYPSIEAGKAAAFILMKARYKPASCSGEPCTQDFPFRFKLSTQ